MIEISAHFNGLFGDSRARSARRVSAIVGPSLAFIWTRPPASGGRQKADRRVASRFAKRNFQMARRGSFQPSARARARKYPYSKLDLNWPHSARGARWPACRAAYAMSRARINHPDLLASSARRPVFASATISAPYSGPKVPLAAPEAPATVECGSPRSEFAFGFEFEFEK